MFQASPALAGLLLFLASTLGFAQGDAKRGEYLAKAGGVTTAVGMPRMASTSLAKR